MSGRPKVPDRRLAIMAGVLLVLAGGWLLTDAYERRGKDRPLVMRLLP